MLSPSDYLGKDALWLCKKLRLKDFTAEELTYCAISLAEEINPKINAIVTNNFDQALLNAKYIDKNSELLEISPISGLPFLIKDLTLFFLILLITSILELRLILFLAEV